MAASIYRDFLLEFKKSCTKREAVARLFGWVTGPIYNNQEFIISEEGYLYESDLIYANELKDTLENTFRDLLEPLQCELDEAISTNASDDVIKEKEAAFDECSAKIYKAERYLIAIEEELCKGESSVLKIDQEATRKSGIPHIMLGSFDQWARDNYGIVILQPTEAHLNKSQSENLKRSCGQQKNLRSTKLDNLHVTFAFLLEAYFNSSTRYKNNEKMNVSTMAEHIEALIIDSNNNQKLPGQSHEAIKTRIEDAMEAKKQKLPINS
jgi:hypothetical protein